MAASLMLSSPVALAFNPPDPSTYAPAVYQGTVMATFYRRDPGSNRFPAVDEYKISYRNAEGKWVWNRHISGVPAKTPKDKALVTFTLSRAWEDYSAVEVSPFLMSGDNEERIAASAWFWETVAPLYH